MGRFVHDPPPIYLLIHLYQYGFMSIYFFLWVVIQYSTLLLTFFWLWPFGTYVFLICPPFLLVAHTFWCRKMLQSHLVFSLSQPPEESAVFPRSLGFFIGEKYLETQIWFLNELDVLTATGLSLL